jgi:hypothetical protein
MLTSRRLTGVLNVLLTVALLGACDEQTMDKANQVAGEVLSCTPGAMGCVCKEGLCGAGLTCTDIEGFELCLPLDHCPNGTFGCPCYKDDTCDLDEVGNPMVCMEGTCARTGCEPGERGCPCLSGVGCIEVADACDNGMCVEDTGQTVEPPASPICYTPCKGNNVVGTTLIAACDGEGLMKGCVEDTTCVHGSCLTDEELKLSWDQATACSADAQCAFFQDCVQGHCYSTCETSSDCRMGRECMKKVCRLPCVATGEECGLDEYCQTVDGQSGFCMPLMLKRPQAAPPGPLSSQVSARAVFDVRAGAEGLTDVLRFTVATPWALVEVENLSDRPVTFTFAPVRQKHWDQTGKEQVVDADHNPLNWLGVELWDGEEQLEVHAGLSWASMDFTMEPGALRTLKITEASKGPHARWEGTLRVTADDDAAQEINATFARSPEGYWAGEMVFFGNFGTSGLEGYLAGSKSADEVGNALLQKWFALKQHDLTLFEFRDILSSTAKGSWKDPIIQSKCPEEGLALGNHACYPTSIGDGVGHYSFDTDAVPVPSGVLELPVGMILAQKSPGDPKAWKGVVKTSDTLHYPGNPAIEVVFKTTPETCLAGTATCLAFLDSLDFTSWIGARREIGADEDCPTGLLARLQPWFVPLFEDGTALNQSDGQRYKKSCRNWTFPFVAEGQPAGWPQDIKDHNASFSGGNPLPIGRTLRRDVDLIDGALIDQDTIFAIIRETVPSFLDPSGKETVSAYGYLLMRRAGPLEPGTEFTAGQAPSGGTASAEAQVTCSQALLDEVFPGSGLTPSLFPISNADTKRRMGLAMITGLVPPEADDALATNQVHWLCHDTDLFDTGPNGDAPCPETSPVTWFKFEGAPAILGASLPCQNGLCEAGEACSEYRCGAPCTPGDPTCEEQDDDVLCGGCAEDEACLAPCEVGKPCTTANGSGACAAQLAWWASHDSVLLNPACYCTDTGTPCSPTGTTCASDRLDLTAGRTFYGVQAVVPLAPATDSQPGDLVPHYLCHETGFIDMGPQGAAACPMTSKVEFFALKDADAAVRGLPCQTAPGICYAGEGCATVFKNSDGSVGAAQCNPGDVCGAKGNCAEYVAGLKADAGKTGFIPLTGWGCTDPAVTTCLFPEDPNALDLRANKIFYTPEAAEVVFRDLATEIGEAFRYRTRFQTRQGTQVGFAPEACDPSNVIPYCYDAPAIEVLEERIDCAAYIYSSFYDDLMTAGHLDAIQELRSFLDFAFSLREHLLPGLPDPVIEPGFEQLYSELLVMLGDESVTRAFGSRFDLVGQKLAEFPGDQMEPGGLRVGGKPGYELRSLYQGVQYYQLVLDRFFQHGPLIAESLDDDAAGPPLLDGFIDAETAVSYLPRVAMAATKKARAWEAISGLYEGFGQIELARFVLERASAEAFLESVILLQVMDAIAWTSDPAAAVSIRWEKEQRQLEFSRALRKMRSRYDSLTEEESFLGVPDSFVPIPPMDIVSESIQAVNSFDVALETAFDRLAIAKESEEIALAQKRDFDTDQVAFKSELAKLNQNFDDELSAICGSFIGTDGGVHPAIPRNAVLSDETRAMGNPCGLVGNGAIQDAMLELDGLILDADGVRQRMQNINAKALDMTAQVSEQCNRIVGLSDLLVSLEGETTTLSYRRDQMEQAVSGLDRAKDFATDLRDGVTCIAGLSTDCPVKIAATAVWLGASAVLTVAATAVQIGLPELTQQLGSVEEEKVEAQTLTECEAMRIDLQYGLKDLYREMLETQLEAAKAQIAIDQKLAAIRGLLNDAESAISNYDTNLQLSIDAAAAHNDPNIRIIKNEAIIVADKHFQRAMREAYRATRVYEYYTSQSYAAWADLKLIRLAAVGESSLQDYLLDLEDAFLEFEYQFGQPDLRLEIISLRDDIVPVLRKNTAMTEEERNKAFHDALQDIAMRDARGWIVLPFSTALKRTSPITANHKVMYVEAELVGRDLGDALGRLYVRQTGTGTLRQLAGDLDQKTFPPATAVINTIFNGRRGNQYMDFDPALYKNWRLRDRPLVNTGWELIFNPRDEYVNQDIDLDGLQDMLLYVYYTDFTTLDTVTQ